MFEVALDSSWKALSSHTHLGGFRWLELEHEASVCACISYGCRLPSDLILRALLWLEDERVTPVYLISLLGSVSHYERSHTAGRGGNPAGGAPGGG
ncbi:hypothetical protein F511_34464 [Dorcoceras hygrometricum]|uniref:Uncharacterized protein n=1 Tax=Dorcoceras hygrometricum TaxID=472368 RepID=A0A2Z7CYU1_9LAMI|nr:hypothetical protein F511_34464 [Dorcoceras hygrometricum]